MISKSLSTSEKRAALHETAGKLAEFCQALYPLLVAHADDWGCLQGDVFTIKNLIDPSSPRKLHEFETALSVMHNVGLIVWYQHAEKWYVAIADFSKYQDLKGHTKDGRVRPIPGPPENAPKFVVGGNSPPNSPKLPLREEKRREGKRTEPIRSPNESGTAHDDEERRKDENKEVAVFIAKFCDIYAKHRHGARYFIKREKHVPLIKAMLKIFGMERLEHLALMLLKTDDDWVHHTDRGIEILSVKASWLDNKLAEYESTHGPIKVTA